VVGKIVEGEAHGEARPGTNDIVRLNALSTMSQSRIEAPLELPSGVIRTRPGAAAASDARLADQIFSLVYRQMHALWGRYRSDFDDLVQVAAEQALRALPSFRRESELSTWTYRICYHTVRKHQRWSTRWLRRFTLDAPGADAPVRLPAASDVLEEHERAERLHRALDRLSAKRRAVVVMRDLEGLGIAEIADIVVASEPTVRSRLRDARKELSSLLEQDPYFGTEACDTEAK
jgi:RNA polymerase sigma factor (sigma-70 family)